MVFFFLCLVPGWISFECFSLSGFEWFAPRKVYLLVAGGLLITSLIAAIFMFGLRDTVSYPAYCNEFVIGLFKVRANLRGWFIFAMLLNIPIMAIVGGMACCTVKVKIVRKRALLS